MPYRVQGNIVEHKVGDIWKPKQHCKSHQAALRAMRLLEAIKHNPDFKPRNN